MNIRQLRKPTPPSQQMELDENRVTLKQLEDISRNTIDISSQLNSVKVNAFENGRTARRLG